MSDPFDLQRFVTAQEDVYAGVAEELRRGVKTSHWMWFIFPQMKGLGHSGMAERFGIGSRAEATAYAGHAVLGPRLVECTALVNRIEGRSAAEIFGAIDRLKFRSSMTLFAAVTDNPVFPQALNKFYQGEADPLTLELLRG